MSMVSWMEFVIRCLMWSLLLGMVMGGVFYLFTDREDVAAVVGLVILVASWLVFLWVLPREEPPRSRFRARARRKP